MKPKHILTFIVAVIFAMGIVGFIVWRHNNFRKRCENQLRQLYCPMECCMPMELGLTNGTPLDPKILVTYLKDKKIPKCPCGPEYEIIWVVGGPPPKCPYHGDLLAAISHVNNHRDVQGDRKNVNFQSEPDIIIEMAIEPYRKKPYSELIKMIDAEPNTLDLRWSCSKAYQVSIWAMWENESNGNVCVIGMVNAKEDEDTLVPCKRSFIKNPSNQFVNEQARDREYKKLNRLQTL